MTIHVSQLFHFPVKSLKGTQLNQMTLDAFGPQWDRRFMLIDSNGRFVTQRQCPLMGQISVSILDDQLTLKYQAQETGLDLATLNQFDQFQLVKVWDDEVNARLIEGDINAWLSDILQRDVTLCFMDADTHRQVDLEFAQLGDRASFSDGFPFLIISEASVAFLSDELGRELSVERFRPNIVVSGCDAFAEDNWKRIAINGVEFDIVKSCSRCVIPTLDLNTSEKQPDVMQVMLKHRKQGKKVMMGQNAVHRGLGVLEVGQVIEVLA
ncbi:MOSC domain-containing protein [Pseudomonas sp. HK3]